MTMTFPFNEFYKIGVVGGGGLCKTFVFYLYDLSAKYITSNSLYFFSSSFCIIGSCARFDHFYKQPYSNTYLEFLMIFSTKLKLNFGLNQKHHDISLLILLLTGPFYHLVHLNLYHQAEI